MSSEERSSIRPMNGKLGRSPRRLLSTYEGSNSETGRQCERCRSRPAGNRGREAWLVRGAWKVLCLQGKARTTRIERPAPSCEQAVKEVFGIKRKAVLGSAHHHLPTAVSIGNASGQVVRVAVLAGQSEVVVVPPSDVELPIVPVAPDPEEGGLAKVERGIRHGAKGAGRETCSQRGFGGEKSHVLSRVYWNGGRRFWKIFPNTEPPVARGKIPATARRHRRVDIEELCERLILPDLSVYFLYRFILVQLVGERASHVKFYWKPV